MKILLISNSFGVNLQKYVKEIAKLNGLDLSIYTLYIGGCSLQTHDQNIKENNKAYELFVDGSSTGRFVSINEALKFETWDYVSLQQASHLSGDVSSYYPCFNNVYTYVRKVCPSSKIMFHQTWPYSRKNPYKFNEVKTWLPTFKFKDSFEMAQGIESSLRKIKEDYKIDLVVESGTTVIKANDAFDDVYDSEGFHLNDLGCYLIGLNFVKTFLNKPIKNIYIPNELDKETCQKAVRFTNRYFDSIKNVKILGRYVQDGQTIKLFNVCSTVSILAKGRSISFGITSRVRSGYYYIIKDKDYANKKKCFLECDKSIYQIHYLNDDKPHIFDIVKANESMDNTLEIFNIEYDGEILKQDDKKLVQVYGDSSIAGFGILAHEGEADIHTNDGVENFCFRALYSLGFDYDIFAASGWGLTFSLYTSPMNVGIEKFRDKICVCSDTEFKQKTPDFLMVSLGTNDYAFISENPENSQELTGKFIKSYENLIIKERGNNPQIPVLMLYGSLKEENVYSLIEKTYQKLSEKLSNIYLLKLPGDNSAISHHSYVTYHKEMEHVLKEKISIILDCVINK